MTIIRRYVKHVRLRVRENCALEIIAPLWISSAGIAEIVRRKSRWIKRLRAYFRDYPAPAFRSDEIRLLGELFRVVADSGQGHQVEVDLLTKTIKTWRDLAAPAQQAAWLRAYAQVYLVQRLTELGRQHGLAHNRVTIRAQRTRWGSCSARQNISLNWRLIRAPAYVIDYVLLHELMHTRVHNHSRDFWTQLRTVCPDYQRAKAWLKSSERASL